MSILISTIGMVLISLALSEMGYGFNTLIWWFFIIGLACYNVGGRLMK